VLASVAVALLLVILGIVLPLAAQAPPNHTLHPAGVEASGSQPPVVEGRPGG